MDRRRIAPLFTHGQTGLNPVTPGDAAAPRVQVTAPTVRHAKLGAAQVSAAEGLEDGLDFAAKVRDYTDARAFQDA